MRFRTDPSYENDGVWFEFEHIRVKLARQSQNNRQFKEYMAGEYKKVSTAIKVGMLSNDKASEILRGAYAHTIVREWETAIYDDHGNRESWKPGVELLRDNKFVIVPTTPDTVLEYLADPANVDTYNVIREAAQEAEPYREMREDDAKN